VSFLLDTTVIAETTRPAPDPKVLAWFQRVDARDLYISVLSLGEIARGVAMRARHNKAQADALHGWLDATRLNYADRIILVDAEIAEAWGELAALRTLPVIDGLLAATALIRGLTLVTRSTHDLAGIGVTVLNPWEAT
jgi:toxin FitB